MPHEKILQPTPRFEPDTPDDVKAAVLAELEPRGAMIQWSPYPVNDSEQGVGVATGVFRADSGPDGGRECRPDDAFMEWFTRAQINQLIRKLRYARDKAFGADE
jgi:hypothetical protein